MPTATRPQRVPHEPSGRGRGRTQHDDHVAVDAPRRLVGHPAPSALTDGRRGGPVTRQARTRPEGHCGQDRRPTRRFLYASPDLRSDLLEEFRQGLGQALLKKLLELVGAGLEVSHRLRVDVTEGIRGGLEVRCRDSLGRLTQRAW